MAADGAVNPGSDQRALGGVMRAVTRCSMRKPGSTARMRAKLLSNSPAPTARTTPSAISADTSAPASRRWRGPLPPRLVPSPNDPTRSGRDKRSAAPDQQIGDVGARDHEHHPHGAE